MSARVSPDGTRAWSNGEQRATLRLEAALKIVQPGQTVRLLSGVYTEPVEIANKGGSFDRPIVIRGESGVTFDGRRNLVRPTDGESVDRRGYAFIKILDSQEVDPRELHDPERLADRHPSPWKWSGGGLWPN